MYRVFLFIKRHPIFTLLLALIVYLTYWIGNEPTSTPKPDQKQVISAKPSTAAQPMQESKTVQDASSVFVKNLLHTLPEQEYAAYAHQFYSAFTAQGEPKPLSWRTKSGFGVITLEKSYKTSTGAVCRDFAERYTIRRQTQILHGIACGMADASTRTMKWCKLRKNSTPTCMFNDENGLGSFFADSQTSLHNLQLKKNDWTYSIKQFWR